MCTFFWSAAITDDGCLYTWGRGNYGRLGHGKSNDCFVPTAVSTLKGVHVSKVSCGSGDSHTLCVTVDGKVYSWGDGDYGKLGKYLFTRSLRIFKIFRIIYFLNLKPFLGRPFLLQFFANFSKFFECLEFVMFCIFQICFWSFFWKDFIELKRLLLCTFLD